MRRSTPRLYRNNHKYAKKITQFEESSFQKTIFAKLNKYSYDEYS